MSTVPGREALAELYSSTKGCLYPLPIPSRKRPCWPGSPPNAGGVLGSCAPTGTGKTLIAQAALFEALHTRSLVAYYTTPLIALTEQKFR